MIRLLLILGLVVSCGVSTNQKIISASYATATLAYDHVNTFEHQHVEDMIAQATKDGTDADVLATNVATFRKQVDTVDLAIDGLLRSIAAAAALNDGVSIASVTQAVKAVEDQLAAMGVKL